MCRKSGRLGLYQVIGTEPNATLASDTGLENHQPVMSKIGGGVGQLDRERDIERHDTQRSKGRRGSIAWM